MIDKVKEKCTGCASCMNICPKKCIEMQEREDGFLYPVIDYSLCVKCGLCEKACPVIYKPEEFAENLAYAAYNKSTAVRKTSSSGGIFPELAKYVLDEKGTVYGATFSEDFRQVTHIRVDDEKNLPQLFKSKYMQSRINSIYSSVKQDLSEEKKVLFSGTPCQVSGLRAYLGKKYDNLICVDFICHGVPSEKVWQSYIDSQIKKYNHNIDSADFRNKEYGWSNNSVLTLILGKNKIEEPARENLYYRAFLSDICLRKSCYDCSFKSKNGFSDITVGDFWGLYKIAPQMNDQKGTSLVLINSEKGRDIFEKIKNNLEILPVGYEESFSRNPCKYKSAEYNGLSENYLKKVNKDNFEELTEKTLKKLEKKKNRETVSVKAKTEALLKSIYSRIRRIFK